MDMRKLLLAALVAFVLLMASTYLVHGIWLRPVYEALRDSWRPLDQQVAKGWILVVGQLLFTVMFAWVYSRGAEKKAWFGQGIRYGGVITLLVVVPRSLTIYVLFRVPYQLALTWMAVGLVQMVLMGLVVAYFLRPEAAGPAAAEEARKGLA